MADRPQSRKPYIGVSEAQSAAEAQAPRGKPTRAAPQTDRPYLEQNWETRSRRRNVNEPPTNVDAFVAWFGEQWKLEMPTALHGAAMWVDRVSSSERQQGVEPVGGSLTGSLTYDAAFRMRLEEAPDIRDRDADLIRPLAASLSALKRAVPRQHDLLMAIAYAYFDWRSLIGKGFYIRQHIHGQQKPDETVWCVCARSKDADITESRRTLVMALPADVMEAVLMSALTRLWWLLVAREPYIRAVE